VVPFLVGGDVGQVPVFLASRRDYCDKFLMRYPTGEEVIFRRTGPIVASVKRRGG